MPRRLPALVAPAHCGGGGSGAGCRPEVGPAVQRVRGGCCRPTPCSLWHAAAGVWVPPSLLAAACSIGSLTSLQLVASIPNCQLQPLDALRQLLCLRIDFYSTEQDSDDSDEEEDEEAAGQLAWVPQLPALTRLQLREPSGSINLDSCAALRQLSVWDSGRAVLSATAPLQQLTRLELDVLDELGVPWEQLRGVWELELLREDEDQEPVAGITQLTALRALHVNSLCEELPPGDWLVGVTRLVLESCECLQAGFRGGVAAGQRGCARHKPVRCVALPVLLARACCPASQLATGQLCPPSCPLYPSTGPCRRTLAALGGARGV